MASLLDSSVHHFRTTDHSRTWYGTVFPGYCPKSVGPPTSVLNCAWTSIFPSPKISSHSSFHESGEWQNILYGYPSGWKNPFSARPPCAPMSTEPGIGERRPASARANWTCASSEKRWKSAPVKMAETCPRRALRLVTLLRGGAEDGGSEVGVKGGATSRKDWLKTSPSMNGTGKVSGVDLKSSWPSSHSSVYVSQR